MIRDVRSPFKDEEKGLRTMARPYVGWDPEMLAAFEEWAGDMLVCWRGDPDSDESQVWEPSTFPDLQPELREYIASIVDTLSDFVERASAAYLSALEDAEIVHEDDWEEAGRDAAALPDLDAPPYPVGERLWEDLVQRTGFLEAVLAGAGAFDAVHVTDSRFRSEGSPVFEAVCAISGLAGYDEAIEDRIFRAALDRHRNEG